jgi:hypothetical protein
MQSEIDVLEIEIENWRIDIEKGMKMEESIKNVCSQ